MLLSFGRTDNLISGGCCSTRLNSCAEVRLSVICLSDSSGSNETNDYKHVQEFESIDSNRIIRA